MSTDYISVSQAAEEIGVTSARINVFIQENRIKADKVGPNYIIHKEEIERFRAIPRTSGKPKKNNSNP